MNTVEQLIQEIHTVQMSRQLSKDFTANSQYFLIPSLHTFWSVEFFYKYNGPYFLILILEGLTVWLKCELTIYDNNLTPLEIIFVGNPNLQKWLLEMFSIMVIVLGNGIDDPYWGWGCEFFILC